MDGLGISYILEIFEVSAGVGVGVTKTRPSGDVHPLQRIAWPRPSCGLRMEIDKHELSISRASWGCYRRGRLTQGLRGALDASRNLLLSPIREANPQGRNSLISLMMLYVLLAVSELKEESPG